ncbi:MAG: AMP-binding protein [Marinilabiliaceae bacterium]|nr:AMP-binding protein [Marinilabiliaceae bacterium]
MDSNGYIEMIRKILVENSDKLAFSDYQGKNYTFRKVAKQIYYLHVIFDDIGIQKGDKIALIGRNMSSWSISYLAIITYGAVVVPILPDFMSNDIHNIINHSDAVLLMSTQLMYDKIDEHELRHLKGIISLNDFKQVLYDPLRKIKKAMAKADMVLKRQPIPFDVNVLKFPEIGPDEVMVLSYTSGTSGFSKGVLIPHRSLWSNVQFACDSFELYNGDRIVSFLPLAHTYGCLFEFLWPFILGCHITFLLRTPTPQVISEAFQNVKPHIILCVPLIIEKIFKRKIMPQLESSTLKALLKLPVANTFIYSKIKSSLTKAFGNEFREIVIGGAALNKDVESFLKKIKFKFTVGYGMTETGPLISYSNWKKTRLQSAGQVVHRMEVRIDSSDPENIAGEIQTKGDNVMLGYYKNDDATRDVFTDDGWLKTGDLGVKDNENFVYIRGRSKNLILGPSGQNIYPEEIEAVLSANEFVQECLVREKDGKIEALVYPDYEKCQDMKFTNKDIEEKLQAVRAAVNSDLPPYSQISKMILFPEEFEKTPKKSIKRYKYLK